MKTFQQDKKSYFQREKENRRSSFSSKRYSDDQGDKFDKKRNRVPQNHNIPDIDLDDEE